MIWSDTLPKQLLCFKPYICDRNGVGYRSFGSEGPKISLKLTWGGPDLPDISLKQSWFFWCRFPLICEPTMESVFLAIYFVATEYEVGNCVKLWKLCVWHIVMKPLIVTKTQLHWFMFPRGGITVKHLVSASGKKRANLNTRNTLQRFP